MHYTGQSTLSIHLIACKPYISLHVKQDLDAYLSYHFSGHLLSSIHS